VKVTAEGPDGADATQLADGVEVFSELPVNASFSASPRRAMINEDVLFTLDSAAGVTATRWDFGDGSTASNSLARHSYAKVGDYDIGVEASGPGGKDASTRKGFVQIRAEVPLEAVFSWAPKTVIAGQEVQLIDESVGGPAKWLWEIPGVGIRSERSPVIVFAKPEKVSVRLTVEKEGQRRSLEKEIAVTNPPPPLLQARFEATPANGQSPLKVQFTDKSGGVVAKYSWDFGDGQMSDLRNPIHEYKLQGEAQSFHPRLAIADSTGQEAKDSGSVVISVVPPPPWWRWPLAGAVALIAIAGWVWVANKPTRLVGRVAWQEQGQTKKKELEGTSFDLATLQLKAITPGKYILRNIRRAGPFLIQERREPRRLEHNQQFEAEGIKLTYLEY
jgi:PKD repeat protein